MKNNEDLQFHRMSFHWKPSILLNEYYEWKSFCYISIIVYRKKCRILCQSLKNQSLKSGSRNYVHSMKWLSMKRPHPVACAAVFVVYYGSNAICFYYILLSIAIYKLEKWHHNQRLNTLEKRIAQPQWWLLCVGAAGTWYHFSIFLVFDAHGCTSRHRRRLNNGTKVIFPFSIHRVCLLFSFIFYYPFYAKLQHTT